MAYPHDITDLFIKNLEEVARTGYDFLRPGTIPGEKGTQPEAFDGFLSSMKDGHRGVYIELPTGTGKTPLSIAIIKQYLKAAAEYAARHPDKPKKRVLFVVPQERLAVQAARSIARFMPELVSHIEVDNDAGREIDWENSAVGMQYGRRKHAHRRPDVLITTYQSLMRDRDNSVYPPEEYGFVVYDEGHKLTAAKFGQAVDKFRQGDAFEAKEKYAGAIQLGVTATPEYSVDKCIQDKLPHCAFTLRREGKSGIAEAMRRGDLCQARPTLLMTNYTVDEKKFAQYVAANGGRPLSQAQRQALFNQEGRNKAVIATYLAATDPDTKEQYLGQNGMIFCAGIQHANDVVRQFGNALGTARYKEVRQWLKQEGVEPIAAVHGGAKGAWLRPGLILDREGVPVTEGRKWRETEKRVTKERVIQEWYTEEEIFDLHAQGKILLLASASKLKEGYDCARDALLFDLCDRYSKVEATQIVGRALRLNPPDPDNRDPGDPDKHAKLFHCVDRNTYDLYKNNKHMLPIYAAEVLEGARFRKPGKRPGTLRRYTQPPPKVDETLEAAGFTLETDINRIRAISAQYKNEREEKLPEKTDDDLGFNEELPRALHVDRKNLAYAAWRKKTEATVAAGGTVEIGGFKVIKMRSSSYTPCCLHKDAVPALAKQLGIKWSAEELPEKTENDLALAGELPNKLRVSPKNSTYVAWRKKTEATVAVGRTVEIDGHQVKKMKVDANNGTPYCLHKDAVPALAKQLGIKWTAEEFPKKTENDLTLGQELPRALHVDLENPTYAAWRKKTLATVAAGGTVEIGGFKVLKMRSRSNTPCCLHKDAVPALQKRLEELKQELAAEAQEEAVGGDAREDLKSKRPGPRAKPEKQGREAPTSGGGRSL